MYYWFRELLFPPHPRFKLIIHVLDNEKVDEIYHLAEKLFNFKCSTTLQDGIKKLWNYFLEK
jgi:hypothetical protein